MLKEMLPLFSTFCVVIAILWLSHYASKKIAARGVSLQSSKYIRVIDKIRLTQDSAIVIVEISGGKYLIGVSSGGISLITELSGDELTPALSDDKTELNLDAFKGKFAELLADKINKLKK